MTFWQYVSQNPFWTLIYLLLICATIESVALIVRRRRG